MLADWRLSLRGIERAGAGDDRAGCGTCAAPDAPMASVTTPSATCAGLFLMPAGAARKIRLRSRVTTHSGSLAISSTVGCNRWKLLRFVKTSANAPCVPRQPRPAPARRRRRANTKKQDTPDEILAARSRKQLLAWLRRRPLLHHDTDSAGRWCTPGVAAMGSRRGQWLAAEAEEMLGGDAATTHFAHMGGDLPDHWREDLAGYERLRVIVNAFTRLRYWDREGNMDLRLPGAPGSQPPDLAPWFQAPSRCSRGLETRLRPQVHARGASGRRRVGARRRLPVGAASLRGAPRTAGGPDFQCSVPGPRSPHVA